MHSTLGDHVTGGGRHFERFVQVARRRLELAFGHAGRDDGAAELRIELHTLAGEAAMVALGELADATRRVEADACAWLERGDTTARVKAARGLRLLSRSVDELARSPAEPARSVAAAPAAPRGPTGPGGADAGDARRTVLVIDDSAAIRGQIADALADAQFEVAVAGDLNTALDAVRSVKPVLVLTDVNLPGTACDELCARLRASAPEPLHLMLMSGMPEPELAARSCAVGAEFWVTKHGGLDPIVDRVTSVLRTIAGAGR